MVVPASEVSDEKLMLYPVTFRHLIFQIRVVSTGCVVSCLVSVLFPLDLRSSADWLSSRTVVNERGTDPTTGRSRADSRRGRNFVPQRPNLPRDTNDFLSNN
jgi:hypothetical protein